MKLPVFVFIVFLFSTLSVSATPPDLVCSGGGYDQSVRFSIPLVSAQVSIYDYGTVPMSAYHIDLKYGDPSERTDVEMYGDHMIAQWLLDGRADLRFYFEETDDQGEIISYDLIIRTKETGEIAMDSGQKVHHGQFEFRVISGSFREGSRSIIFEAAGKAVCD